MINVLITRSSGLGTIVGFEVKGHAGYAKRGEDIVCAGVSTVTFGTVNSIEFLTGISIDTSVKNGFLSGTISSIEDTEKSAKVQLLLESMVVMLNDIAESYGKYIKIQQDII
ncbi:ribosomal-processing cysteine protease Prp [Paenibacillus sp. 19GGS1-52]|uniref:ribosomal-processing cysteine protease Prp n=1 Tax=Paenibacillus sp. 19GGS1-52 TaxID=2758563 RepID=UPI001EFA6692|nr:ribosomal-processing cysteine protease Prp [Paenibacillus sp. 19GGS1-52]ULO08686.1 ribosomal-processing cysteine protease Prp [Paenibacillus sp. 19GGS1-52]